MKEYTLLSARRSALSKSTAFKEFADRIETLGRAGWTLVSPVPLKWECLIGDYDRESLSGFLFERDLEEGR